MKSIDTLVSDIYGLFDKPVSVDPEKVTALGQEIAESVVAALGPREEHSGLRFSNIGTPCKRKLWYSCRSPQLAEKLPAHIRIKFLFGNILESVLLFLSETSGHEVTGRQTELDIGGIKGHRDALIDGRTVDVKTASTASFRKFKSNGLREDDPFGYIDQVNAYRVADETAAARDDHKVSFLAIDKQLGHICLDTYEANNIDYDKKIEDLKTLIDNDFPPERNYQDEPEGKSGNRKLPTPCSYCQFKQVCWPGLRTFHYANGPVFLTKVTKEPNVREFRNELF
jgi:hypothetical protein